jgi:hypothetical protein
MTKQINKAGSPPPHFCTGCGDELTEANRRNRKGTQRGYRSQCRKCISLAERTAKASGCRKPRVPKSGEETKKSNLKKYGLTIEQFDEMFYAQLGRCASCQSPLSSLRLTHLDHCHETGRVRGLLCYQCNVALGLLQEEATRAIMLAGYITEYC